MGTIQLKRGQESGLAALKLAEGEPAVALDTAKLYVGTPDGNRLVKAETETDSTLTIAGAAADAKTVGDMLRDLMYEPVAIKSFTNSVGTVEKGATVTEATLSWALSRTPESLTLDGAALDTSLTGKALAGLSITADKTYTLTATDERGATATATTKITFLNGVYWGTGSADAAMDSAFIRTLTRGLQGSRAKTFAVTADAEEHIYFACPARYGTPTFNVGGFDGGFTKAATMDFTNASGYTESYNVYKSDNAGLGGTTVKVS